MSVAEERGLPADLDAERYTLGSVIVDSSAFVHVGSLLEPDDFSIESHRRIFRVMVVLNDLGQKIDHATIASALRDRSYLESVGGLTGLMALTDGIPRPPNAESYCRIVKEKSKMRRIIFTAQKAMNSAMIGEQAPDEIIESLNQTMVDLAVSSVDGDQTHSPADIVHGYEGGISEFMDPSRRSAGMQTGYIRFDDMTGGLRPGELFILAARPSVGKSSLARNIAQHVVLKHKRPVVLFSLEMSKESVLQSMMCSAARVDSQKFRLGMLGSEERMKLNHSLGDLLDAPLEIDERSSLTVFDIRSTLIKLAKRLGPLGLVIIDYLQLLGSKGKIDNRVQEVSAQSRALKIMAKELRVPIIALSQLSRAVEQRKGDHRPQLSDLRESGAIEQDADLVGFLFRQEMYERDRDDLRNQAELILAKQRSGPTGTIRLTWMPAITKFENHCDEFNLYEEHKAI